LEFTALGTTAHGKDFGTCYVVPDLKGETRFGVKKGRATRSALALRDAITEAIDSCGTNLTLRGTGPTVRAVDIKYVRAEFDRRYVIDQPDPKKQAHAKLVAFNRALEKLPTGFGMGAQDGTQWIWRI
jgi:hypothetical protein